MSPVSEAEIKKFIITTLKLEDLEPNDIGSKQPLFNEGLGLDSIDALELGIAISRNFGVKVTEDNQSNRDHFASVEALTSFINSNLS